LAKFNHKIDILAKFQKLKIFFSEKSEFLPEKKTLPKTDYLNSYLTCIKSGVVFFPVKSVVDRLPAPAQSGNVAN